MVESRLANYGKKTWKAEADLHWSDWGDHQICAWFHLKLLGLGAITGYAEHQYLSNGNGSQLLLI